MLRRLKAQVSHVANELPGVISPGANGASFRESARQQHAELADENGEIEGFLCPMCMTHFPSPEQLSHHFETAHTEKADGFVNPNYNVETSNSSSFSIEKDSLDELRLQLREEKAFAGKLKEELDRIQSVVAQATDVPDGEVPYLLQQIQVLEAGKSMVTQRMLEFEKEASQFRRAVENANKERSEIMSKLKQQSQQIRQMTDDAENVKVEKEMLNRELLQTRRDIDKMSKEIEQLHKTLDQRPSDDDVAVLRTELVHAQKLMDEIAQQKDVEIQEHMNSIRHLNLEREKDNCIKESLKKELASNGSVLNENDSKLASALKELDDVKQLLEVSRQETNAAKESTKQSEKRVTELQTRLDSNIQELTVCREKITQLEGTVKKSSSEIEGSHTLNAKNQEKLLALSQKLEQMIEEKRKQDMDILTFEEKQQEQADNIKSLELANSELTKEMSSLGQLLEQERIVLTQKNAENEDLSRKVVDLQAQLDASSRKAERQLKDLEDSAKTVDGLRVKIAGLENNAQELMTKISEGEGGSKMAIDQLASDNKKLAENITELNSLLEEQKQLREVEIEKLNKTMRETENQASLSLQKVKSEADDLRRQLQESEDEVKRNGDRFVEMERESEAERKKATERFEKLKELIQQRDSLTTSLKQQVEQLSTENNEKVGLIREKERHLEESRLKIEESVKKLEEAEIKARQLEAELRNAESLRETASSIETDLREELKKAQLDIESLKNEGSQLTSTIAEKKAEYFTLKEEMENNVKHWNFRKQEFDAQLLKNQEDNEELLQSNTDLQAKLDVSIKTIAEKESALEESKSRTTELFSQIGELESEISSTKAAMQAKIQELESDLLDKCDLESDNNSLRDELAAHKETIKELTLKIDDGQKEITKLTTQASGLESRVDELSKYSSDMKENISRLEADKKEIQAIVTEKEVEIDILNGRITRIDEGMEQMMSEHEKKLNEERRELLSMKDAHDALLVAQAESTETVKMMKNEIASLQSELNVANEKAKQAELRCSQFEKLVKDIQCAKEKEMNEKQEGLNKLHAQLEEQELLFASEKSQLQEELSKVQRIVQSLQSEIDERSRELSEATATAQELTTKSMEQLKKMASWEEEKNALVERCLKTESDLEFERERALENKRRFDDSVAAMHELGRANQSLQMDISKHSSRKWLDDSAAVNCTACGKMFTMTIRKHHCRVCGLIFCASCSDKTAKIVSNKSPVRVCSTCFTEVSNR